MKSISTITALAAALLFWGCSPSGSDQNSTGSASADQSSAQGASGASASGSIDASASSGSSKQPDNTGVNKRDRSDEALTSGDQGNSEADREITRKIRRAITSNDQLSTTAKNIKIITADGKTTLRGPVKSEQEKQQIVAAAKAVQGAQLDDQLEVKSQTNQ